MSAAWLACIPTVVLVSVASSPAAQLPWMNASLPVDARVELLLGAMSNQEKTAQLNYGTILLDPRREAARATTPNVLYTLHFHSLFTNTVQLCTTLQRLEHGRSIRLFAAR